MQPISVSVGEYAARGPYAVGPHEPLSNTRRLMDKYGVRDLPVRAEGKLVGILSERDLRLLSKFGASAPETLTVERAMTADPYAVAPDTPLEEVVRGMLARKVDAAVIVDEGQIIGVFSATDAMRALADMLQGKLTHGDARMKPMFPGARHGSRGRAAR